MQFINDMKITQTAGFAYKSYKKMAADDGPCWSASIWLEGKKIGEVSDGGFGGPLNIEMPEAEMDRLVEALKAAGYVLDLRIEGTEIVLDEPKNNHDWLELVLPDLADSYDALKYWKSKCKTKIIFRKKGAKPDELLEYKKVYTEEFAAGIRKHYGDDLDMILNEAIAGL